MISLGKNLSEPQGNLRFLDGLRGILCIIVVIDHCVNTFMPSLRYTNEADTFGHIKHLIALTPLNIIYSGIPSVSLFFIMSGFVISYKYNKTKNKQIVSKSTIKRYFRFVIPITFSYIFMHLSSIFLWKYQVNLNTALYQSFYGCEFTHESMINYALWTISFEMFGSYLIFSLIGIFGDLRINILAYSVVLLFLINTNYYFFVLGLIFSVFYSKNNFNNIKVSYLLIIPTYILSIIFITYPFQRFGVQIGGIYKYISFSKDWGWNYSISVKIGCTLLFSCVLFDRKINKFLSNDIFLFLGKISFPIYLLHVTVIQSLSNYFAEIGFSKFLILTIFSISITIFISIPFEIFIDRKSIKLSNYIANKLIH